MENLMLVMSGFRCQLFIENDKCKVKSEGPYFNLLSYVYFS